MADEELMEETTEEEPIENPQPTGFRLPSLPTPVEVDKEAAKDVFSLDMREDMDDITGMSDEDRAWAFGTAGIGELDDEEELDDLFDVSEEDIIGEEPQESKPKPRYRIPPRRTPPTTTLGGLQL